jgi:cobalt-zinc-cadmium efflux system membrane fusion protein
MRTSHLLLAVLLGASALACKKPEGGPAPAASSEVEPLCEHHVQKSICTKCNPTLAPVFQAKKDWCPEHGFPESVCPICHPERGGRPKAPQAGKKDDDDDDKKIQLSARVLEKAKVRTEAAKKQTVDLGLAASGDVVADPDRSARVTSPIAGRIEQVSFKEGASVKKGEVLAVVRVPELGKARAAFAATTVRGAAARANADRLKALADRGLASKQEVVAASAEADALEAESKAAAEQLGALGSSPGGAGTSLAIRSPLAGVVTRRNAVLGQAITAEEAIANVIDLSELWFLARVYEKDVGRIDVGRRAEVQLTAYPNERFVGAVEYLGKEIDPGARTFTARVRLENTKGILRVGLFGTARIATGEERKEPTLAVPRSAIADIDGKTCVFVKEADGFEKREVELGLVGVERAQILRGVREGELVVVEGVFTLKSIAMKDAMGDDD